MYNEMIRLGKMTDTEDAYGDMVRSIEYSEDLHVRKQSIGAKEFYQAAAMGLKPEIKFILPNQWDYNGERILSYEGQEYSILRTYQTENQELEITCTREINNANTEVGS